MNKRRILDLAINADGRIITTAEDIARYGEKPNIVNIDWRIGIEYHWPALGLKITATPIHKDENYGALVWRQGGFWSTDGNPDANDQIDGMTYLTTNHSEEELLFIFGHARLDPPESYDEFVNRVHQMANSISLDAAVAEDEEDDAIELQRIHESSVLSDDSKKAKSIAIAKQTTSPEILDLVIAYYGPLPREN
ncbi:hypothetical protein ACK8P5_26210 (plasmid) [Paenibacillus sp. EC2-1]|uniref:hypothetical protein n=1 Tax=Paenibacillus sp. EC2-1 TaxID=3388665 RepID=UPI003BEEBC79